MCPVIIILTFKYILIIHMIMNFTVFVYWLYFHKYILNDTVITVTLTIIQATELRIKEVKKK
jgi:uncharacterized membrane protein YqjE